MIDFTKRSKWETSAFRPLGSLLMRMWIDLACKSLQLWNYFYSENISIGSKMIITIINGICNVHR